MNTWETLSLEDKFTLSQLLQAAIVKHGPEAAIDYVCRRITKEEFEWHQSHAEYLKSIRRKLFG